MPLRQALCEARVGVGLKLENGLRQVEDFGRLRWVAKARVVAVEAGCSDDTLARGSLEVVGREWGGQRRDVIRVCANDDLLEGKIKAVGGE